jgi:hypothetical protein
MTGKLDWGDFWPDSTAIIPNSSYSSHTIPEHHERFYSLAETIYTQTRDGKTLRDSHESLSHKSAITSLDRYLSTTALKSHVNRFQPRNVCATAR